MKVDADNLEPVTPPDPGEVLAVLSKEQREHRTIWGLTPVQLHARYWASFGVGVIRTGESAKIPPQAELFLLLSSYNLPLFPLRDVVEMLKWVEPTVLSVRLSEKRNDGYRESVLCEATTDGRGDAFVGFDRIYDGADLRRSRVLITPDREIAELWQQSDDPKTAWKKIRRFVPPGERAAIRVDDARVYDRIDDREIALMLKDLVREWRRPNSTIRRATALGEDATRGKLLDPVWLDPSADAGETKFHGPVWIGAGRRFAPGTTVVGPRVVWDAAEHRPDTSAEEIEWDELEPPKAEWLPDDARPASRPTGSRNVTRRVGQLGRPDGEDEKPGRPDTIIPHRPHAASDAAKRIFDICFSVCALIGTSPLWLILVPAIVIESGRPIFFGHVREGRGGRTFKCWKFRSMRQDAEIVKQRLIAEGKNKADGNQFFMDNDPRVTRVGNFMRKTNLDELPQFWNVLAGDMSIVGPRPSPYKENQNNPAWREGRLSVKPGITGLWQIRRTREEDTDFQEWVRFDLEYVRTRSFWGDIEIIIKTVTMIFNKIARE